MSINMNMLKFMKHLCL